jgi:predicted component of type VI protein secretion system
MALALTIVEGPGLGRAFRLDQPRIAIGRDEGSCVVLPVAGVSRTHATIERRRFTWVLRDERSTNGTRLNGDPLLEPARLRAGDRITIAAVVLRVERQTFARPFAVIAVVVAAGGALLLLARRDAPRAAAPVASPPAAVTTAAVASPPAAVTIAAAPSPPAAPADVEGARLAFERGVRKLEERRIAPRNLFDAWAAFATARDKLQALADKPAPYPDAARLAAETGRDLASDCQRLLFQAVRFERYGETSKAVSTYREVLLHFPGDEPTGCRKKAQEKLALAEEDGQ